MGDSRCEGCGRTIFGSIGGLCFFCWNKDKIDSEGFKPGPDKMATHFKKWNSK